MTLPGESDLVRQLRSDVTVEREERHHVESLLECAVTYLRSIASADPQSSQARWMAQQARLGIPKGQE